MPPPYSAAMPAPTTVGAKICGITTAETLDATIAGGASHIGFNFYAPSPRHVALDVVAVLAARVPARLGKVGVFVDPDDATLAAAIAAAALDAVQLHRVTPGRAAAVRARTGRETWVALAVRTRADLDGAHAFGGAADRILYDAKTPPGTLPGGMGVRFDWALLDGVRHPLPWALSGGLDPGNVGEAITRTGATLVDVCSGVETAPGVKDAGLIAAFLKAVAST